MTDPKITENTKLVSAYSFNRIEIEGTNYCNKLSRWHCPTEYYKDENNSTQSRSLPAQWDFLVKCSGTDCRECVFNIELIQ